MFGQSLNIRQRFMNNQAPTPHRNIEAGPSTQTIMIIACVLSLSLGFFEIIMVSILSRPSAFSTFTLMLPPLFVSVSVFFLTYVVLWFLAISHLGRFLKLDVIPSALSLALFLGTIFILASLNKLFHFPFSLKEIFTLFLLVSVSILASMATYFVTKAITYMSNSRDIAAFFSLAIPFVVAETSVYIWLYLYRIRSVLSVSFFLASLSYIFLLLFSVGLFYRLGNKIKVAGLLLIFMTLVLLSSLLALVATKNPQLSLKGFKEMDHQIKHVILIIDDTLRPDFLSCYNPQSSPTPHIDQLAKDGLVFEKVISAAPWTLPAVSSIITGSSPLVHQAIGKKSKLPDSVKTLAEYMLEAGYYTAAIVRNDFMAPKFNLSQGFLEYNYFPKTPWFGDTLGARLIQLLFPDQFFSDVSTSKLTELAEQWLKSNQEKDFFLWIHYFDPHIPYAPPNEFLPKREPPSSIGKSFSALKLVRGGYVVPSLVERGWIKDLYEAEIHYVDENIGKLLDMLKRLNLYNDSLIIFTSDHGEEFWEHDGYEHGHSLKNELLWVPLIIKLPQSTSKQQLSTVVSTQGIMPTVLDLCGIDHESDNLSVDSFAQLWGSSANTFDKQPIISTGLFYYEDRESIIFDGMKYIRSLLTDREELYDLTRDPGEKFSIVLSFPDKVQRARNILKEYNKIADKLRKFYNIPDREEVKLNKEKIQKLKSLGYIH